MPGVWPSAGVPLAEVTTQLKTARHRKDALIPITSCTWDPRAGRVWREGLHSISGQFHSHTCCLTCLPSWPGHLSNGKTFFNCQKAEEREDLENHEGSKAVTLACTLHTQTPSPLTRRLEHTTHPAPAAASHPHASPGLGVLWTPHTSVSANICSLSPRTPLAKARQDVSTGTHSSQQYVQF